MFRHPPTVINKLWSRIPERPPLQEGQHECDICRARFMDPNNFIRHRGNCRKKTVEEVEENEKEFYNMIEKNQKEKENLKNNDQSVDMENDETEEIIKPTQAKKQCRSRSKKRNWTVSKKRRRNISSSSEPTSKVYVKQKVDVNDLSKSGDKMENVEFYKNVLNKYKTVEKPAPKDEEATHESSTNNSTLSAESRHAPDTDFKVSHNTETGIEGSSEGSLPSINIPVPRYLLCSRNKLMQPEELNEDIKEDGDDSKNVEKNRSAQVSTAEKKSEICDEATSDGDGGSGGEEDGREVGDECNKSSPSPTTRNNPPELNQENEENGNSHKTPHQRHGSKLNRTSTNACSSPKGKKKNEVGSNVETEDNQEDVHKGRPSKYFTRMSTRSCSSDVTNQAIGEGGSKSEISDKPSRMLTRSQKNSAPVDNAENNDETKTASEEEDENDAFYSCKICMQTFKDHVEYKKHKISCTKISKKHQCSKCGKSFTQRNLLNQHFDYRHTDKPKRFMCEPCGKTFELKKTMQEHNLRLHNEKGKKYLCDFCSRLFWHFGEFTVHCASHTGIKPFKCGRCGEASFASSERLTKHLKRCGISGNIQCNKCGKGFSDQLALAKHIKDVHEEGTKWHCPFCTFTYNSEGGYYQHLRTKHGVGRNGKRLSDVLIEKLASERKSAEETSSSQSSQDTSQNEDTKNNSNATPNDENEGKTSELSKVDGTVMLHHLLVRKRKIQHLRLQNQRK